MDLYEFKDNLMCVLPDKLKECGHDVEISERLIEKVNQSYEALCVCPRGHCVAVNVNLDVFYKYYVEDYNFDSVVTQIVDFILQSFLNMPQVNLNYLSDYSFMREKLAIEVVSAERNKGMLSNIPHTIMEDLAIVYRLMFIKENGERNSILITNDILAQFHITKEQLFKDAIEVATTKRPSTLKGISEYTKIPCGSEAEEFLFVASVSDSVFGAGVLAYPGFLKEASEKLGGDFFILPSSINEVILVRDNGDISVDYLESIVSEVNNQTVPPEERLTDSVYHYDSDDDIFELGHKYVMRMAG